MTERRRLLHNHYRFGPNDERGTAPMDIFRFDGEKIVEHWDVLQLLDRRAALMPPPRVHRHRYFGVLAPDALLRAAV